MSRRWRRKPVPEPVERTGKRAKARGPWREALRRQKQRREEVPLSGVQRAGWFAYFRNPGGWVRIPAGFGKARAFWKGWHAAHLADRANQDGAR